MNKKFKKQQGIALVMALIMLLLITVIGVASVRMSSVDTQVSGNSMFSMMVFQGAESALGKIVSTDDRFNLRKAAQKSNVPVAISPTYFTPTETVNGGGQLSTKGEIIYESTVNGLYGGLPNSVGEGEGGTQFIVFRTSAETKLTSTAAKATHIQGIAEPKAKP